MSSWIRDYRNKETGEVVEVFAIDDYLGAHIYGYKLPSGEVLTEDKFSALYEDVRDDI